MNTNILLKLLNSTITKNNFNLDLTNYSLKDYLDLINGDLYFQEKLILEIMQLQSTEFLCLKNQLLSISPINRFMLSYVTCSSEMLSGTAIVVSSSLIVYFYKNISTNIKLDVREVFQPFNFGCIFDCSTNTVVTLLGQ